MKRRLLLSLLALLALWGCQQVIVLQDFDGDGSLDADDCQPSDPLIHPGAEDEYGDGIDQNCDGVDGNAVDLDGDGYTNAVDCDDDNPDIHPGAEDEPGDGIDSNCDGVDGIAVDEDGDGYSNAVDCNDSDPSIYPGAADPEGDGVDQNCDGVDGVAPTGDDDDDTAGDDDDSAGDDDDSTGDDDDDTAVGDDDDAAGDDDDSAGDDDDSAGDDEDSAGDDDDSASDDDDSAGDDDDSASSALVDIAPQGIAMIALSGGTFEMGCTPTQQADGNCAADESPAHDVTLTNDFWMSATEVTQGQWQALVGNNPSHFGACGTDCPVETVNWWEALSYANEVSSAEGLAECYTLTGCTNTLGNDMECSSVTVTSTSGSVYDCTGYRLPTEAEWEYAARAGTDLLYAGSNTPAGVVWYIGNSGNMTHEVATMQANSWGLYDMSGNVWEWNWDWYNLGYYSSSSSADPQGPSSGPYRVYRGGGWSDVADYTRVAKRLLTDPGIGYPDLGFRLSRTIP